MSFILQKFETPFESVPFDKMTNDKFLTYLEDAVDFSRQAIEKIKNHSGPPDFQNTIEAFENSTEKVELISSIFFNLHSSNSNDEMAKIAQEFSPILTRFYNEISFDEILFKKIQKVYEQREEIIIDIDQKTLLEKTYKGFLRSGALLSSEMKERFGQIEEELAKLSLDFAENGLNENAEYLFILENKEDLSGLTPSQVEEAAILAKNKELEGKWAFSFDFPSYSPFMKLSDKRFLREKFFKDHVSRGNKSDKNDNKEIIKKIVRLRQEKAKILGYEKYADFVLEERMASNTKTVLDFLEDMAERSKSYALRDLEELKAYAKENDHIEKFEPWDYSYYFEKVLKNKYNIDDEKLRPYFQLEKVLEGAFTVAQKLYGVKFEERHDISKYHEEVRVFELLNENSEYFGLLYCDFFPRKGKRSGAWMTSFRSQMKKNGIDQRPHVSITCNFTRPTSDRPSLLTFDEVRTLFHEFGHALHGLLSEGRYSSLTGTSVFWDFVELPSQIMENWIYEKECLDLFAFHYETNAPLPIEIVEKIKESSLFQEAYSTYRQLCFAMLDMKWHVAEFQKDIDVEKFEFESIKDFYLYDLVEHQCISTAFSHIFAGGYSAGYYSYKWAEVLDADAFDFFQKRGIFNQEVALSFREHILKNGGSEHPMTLYQRFRGRKPKIDALLVRSGILPQ